MYRISDYISLRCFFSVSEDMVNAVLNTHYCDDVLSVYETIVNVTFLNIFHR